jgi:hypothetical protein
VQFPDRVTGKPREVDIVVVRGRVQGQQVQIGIECVDHTRKADVQWVEMQHGKHGRLKATDFVILVSNTGFTATAKMVAHDLGYRTITPNITKSALAQVISDGLALSVGGFNLVVLTATATFDDSENTSKVEQTDVFVRANKSKLVSAKDFLIGASWQYVAGP